MTPDDQQNALNALEGKLGRFNPRSPNPEVLCSAEGTARNIELTYADSAETRNLAVTLQNHIRSLMNPNIELFNGTLPDVDKTLTAAKDALTKLRQLLVK
jgi:Holliday junction resolvase RusA-like endonuclease